MPDASTNPLGIVRQRCLTHADALLTSAKSTVASGQPYIASHLALLALEEIGEGETMFLKQGDALRPAVNAHPGSIAMRTMT